MKYKCLYLIRGIPGSGKTTLAQYITCHNASADDHMRDEEGRYKYDRTRLQEVHQKCQEDVEEMMQDGCLTIAVHNTFVKREHMGPYYALAHKYNYPVVEVICRGNFESVHNVPQETIDRMRREFEY